VLDASLTPHLTGPLNARKATRTRVTELPEEPCECLNRHPAMQELRETLDQAPRRRVRSESKVSGQVQMRGTVLRRGQRHHHYEHGQCFAVEAFQRPCQASSNDQASSAGRATTRLLSPMVFSVGWWGSGPAACP
jgi:hypothetical protein